VPRSIRDARAYPELAPICRKVTFDAGRALQELATAHEPTMGAVRARLLKYGRINA